MPNQRADIPNVSADKVLIESLLEPGDFASVYSVKSLQELSHERHDKLAMKTLHHHQSTMDSAADMICATRDLVMEAGILSMLPPHKNGTIIHATSNGFWENPETGFDVLEELNEALDSHMNRASCTYELSDVGVGVARGLPQNIGFDSEGNDRLFEFALAEVGQDGDEESEDDITGAGTPRYMAPEVISEKSFHFSTNRFGGDVPHQDSHQRARKVGCQPQEKGLSFSRGGATATVAGLAHQPQRPNQRFRSNNLRGLRALLNVANCNKDRTMSQKVYAFGRTCISRYSDLCETRPVMTKSITASAIVGMGDVIAQWIDTMRTTTSTLSPMGFFSTLNVPRLLSFMMMGLVLDGPFFHYWFSALDRMALWGQQRYKWSKKVQTNMQLLVDQTVGVVLYYPTYFYLFEVVQCLVYRRVPNWPAVHSACWGASLWSVLKMQYAFWPLAHWYVFSYVKPSLRVAASDLLVVFWSIIQCTILSSSAAL